MQPSRVEDDGTIVSAVEILKDGADGQSLTVRAGPFYIGEDPAEDLGIWVNYQSLHLKSDMTGPVLLSVESWRELVSAVERQIEASGYRRTLIGNGVIARELGVRKSTVSNWVTRDILPPELAPEWVEAASTDIAVWHQAQLPLFRAWHEMHRHARQKDEADG